MLSPKRLIEKAKKGIPLMRANSRSNSYGSSSLVLADKGHFILNTIDNTRFMVPLSFPKSHIIQQLLKISEDEFGLYGDGPILLACSAVFMEYIIFTLNRSMSKEVERALLASIDANCSLASATSHLENNHHQLVP